MQRVLNGSVVAVKQLFILARTKRPVPAKNDVPSTFDWPVSSACYHKLIKKVDGYQSEKIDGGEQPFCRLIHPPCHGVLVHLVKWAAHVCRAYCTTYSFCGGQVK